MGKFLLFSSTGFMVQIVHQTREVEVPVEKVVYQDRPVEVERIVYKEIEIPVVSRPASQTLMLVCGGPF